MASTKICRTCEKDLPKEDFREGRRRCIRCEQEAYSKKWSGTTSIVCNKCNIEKPVSDYYKNHKRCKSCYKDSYKNKPKKSKEDRKDYQLKYSYGEDFGLEEYNKLSDSQNHSCAVCKCKNTNGRPDSDYLYVDHCHESGEVRGLLCSNCNRALGLLKDDVYLLQSCINYLNKYKES